MRFATGASRSTRPWCVAHARRRPDAAACAGPTRRGSACGRAHRGAVGLLDRPRGTRRQAQRLHQPALGLVRRQARSARLRRAGKLNAGRVDVGALVRAVARGRPRARRRTGRDAPLAARRSHAGARRALAGRRGRRRCRSRPAAGDPESSSLLSSQHTSGRLRTWCTGAPSR